MISEDSSAVLMLNVDNDIITQADYIDLYFSNVSKNIKPYVDLFSSEEVDLEVKENFVKLKDEEQVSKLHFCSPGTVRSFDGERPSDELFSFEKDLVDIFPLFQKIKKVANRFNKLYILGEDGKLSFEATDKQIPTSNSVKIDIGNSEKDIDVKFNFKYINSLLSMIEPEDYKFKFGFIEEREVGVILFENTDQSESYFITSSDDE